MRILAVRGIGWGGRICWQVLGD